MALFSKRRKDGDLVKDGDPMTRIMPYVMPGRNESAVYYRMTIDTANAQKFIRENRKNGQRITLLNIIAAAMMQTMYRRPRSNRFVVGRRVYQRKNFEVLLVVKEALSDDAFESVAKVPFEKGDNIYDVSNKMAKHILSIRDGNQKIDDKLIEIFSNAPRILVRLILTLLRFMDFHNIMPAWLRESLPFYSSLFISHLGSIGADAPFHHLYEFGTTSIFMTVGRTYDKPVRGIDGALEWRRVVDIATTVDERICDGYYLIKTLKTFERYLQDPWALMAGVETADSEADDQRDKARRLRWFKRRRRHLNRAMQMIPVDLAAEPDQEQGKPAAEASDVAAASETVTSDDHVS